MPVLVSQSSVAAVDAAAIGTRKIVPRLARMAFGLNRSVSGSAAIRPLAPAPSAVRRIAPRLPGFSTPSTTTTSGTPGVKRNDSRSVEPVRTIATIPSDRSPNANLAITASDTSTMSATLPSASWSAARASSLWTCDRATNTVSTLAPAESACRSSRAPSMSVSPVASRSRRSRRRTAAFTRGFVRDVIAGSDEVIRG